MHELLTDALAAAAGVAAAIALLIRLPFGSRLASLVSTIQKALSVIAADQISDHWKERAIPAYSIRLFRLSLELAFFIVGTLAVFVAAFSLTAGLVTGDWQAATVQWLHWRPQLLALGFAVLYLVLRPRPESASTYSATEQALHELALGNPATLGIAFQADCLLPAPKVEPAPVYVAGLARAGTTVLLEALAGTNEFVSLGYRNMPFVTAPRLWTATSRWFRKEIAARERAHGDGILVNADSPEAFEEVFWRMATRSAYIKQLGLEPHEVDPQVIDAYRRFVSNVVSADPHHRPRYLAKGNNNLLRLRSLLTAFPTAHILIPFRAPADHAASLLRQHQRFLQIHDEDSFSARYMTWLGHFEFGSQFRPFLFDPAMAERKDHDRPTFWLDYWHSVYRYLLDHYRDEPQVRFVSYQALVDSPGEVLNGIAGWVGCDRARLQKAAGGIVAGSHASGFDVPSHIRDLYLELAAAAE